MTDVENADLLARSTAATPRISLANARQAGLALSVALLFTLVVAGALTLGYFRLFSGFAPNDDSGYFLVSVQGYMHGAALYTTIHTEYGPFFFQFLAVVYRLLGVRVSNDSAAVITLGMWTAAASLLSIAAFRLLRSTPLALLTWLLSFCALSAASQEPASPGHLVVLLMAAMALAATEIPKRSRLAFTTLGALGGLILLCKVNLGLFALAALAYAIVVSSPSLTRRRPLAELMSIGLVAGPLLLMSRDLGTWEYARYASHSAVCVLALAVAIRPLSTRGLKVDGGSLWWLAWASAGAAAAVAASLVTEVIRGSTPGSVWAGAVDGALTQNVSFSFPPTLAPGTIRWDALALGVVFLVTRLSFGVDRRVRLGASFGRVAAGLAIWVEVCGVARPVELPLTLIWVAALPRIGESATPTNRAVRVFLPTLALLQTLQSYPVAGSQRLLSGVLLVLVGAICVRDGIEEIGVLLPELRSPLQGGISLFAAVWGAVAVLAVPLLSARTAWAAGVSLGVPGAGRVHVDPQSASTYRRLVTVIHKRCATFVTLPGLGSLYLWTGDEPPTYRAGSDWMYAVDASSQARAVGEIENVPKLCVVRSRSLELFWEGTRPVPKRPLYLYLTTAFRTVASPGGFEIMVRNNE